MSVWADALDGALDTVRDTFPEAVSYVLGGGTAQVITGVFDEAHEAHEQEGEVVFSTTRPALGVKLSDLTGTPAQGDRVTLTDSGRVFQVTDVQPDGSGWATLFLARAV